MVFVAVLLVMVPLGFGFELLMTAVDKGDGYFLDGDSTDNCFRASDLGNSGLGSSGLGNSGLGSSDLGSSDLDSSGLGTSGLSVLALSEDSNNTPLCFIACLTVSAERSDSVLGKC